MPTCPRHQRPMVRRKATSPEQVYCGEWFTCDAPGPVPCGLSVLIPSAALTAQLSAQKASTTPA